MTASPSSSTSAPWRAASGVLPKPNLAEKIKIPPLSFSLQPPEEQTDNWDDDFEEGISFSKIQSMPCFFALFVQLLMRAAALEKQPAEDEAKAKEDEKAAR